MAPPGEGARSGASCDSLRAQVFRLPGVQFLALFFYAAPTYEDVASALNVFGIIGALLLSLVLALPSSLGYADCECVHVSPLSCFAAHPRQRAVCP